MFEKIKGEITVLDQIPKNGGQNAYQKTHPPHTAKKSRGKGHMNINKVLKGHHKQLTKTRT